MGSVNGATGLGRRSDCGSFLNAGASLKSAPAPRLDDVAERDHPTRQREESLDPCPPPDVGG